MTLTNGQLLDELGVVRGFAEHRILRAGLWEKPAEVRPWYVQSAVAVVIWVGALFFTSFLAAIDVLDNPVAEVVLGIGFAILGAVGSRHRSGLLRLHLSLVSYAGVTSLLSVFADRGLHLRHAPFFLWIALLQVACLFLFDSRPVRFKATIGISLALFGLVADERTPMRMEILIVGLAGAMVLWWLAEARLTASFASRAVRPIGFGLVISALGASFLSLTGSRDAAIHHPLFLSAVLGCLLLLVVARAAREADATLRSGVVVLALVGAVAMSVLASDAPALLTAALVLTIGRARKEPLLDVAGGIGLVLFIVRVYYSLELSLLWTSFGLAGAGAALLAVRALLLRGEPADDVAPARGSVLSPVLTLPRRATAGVLVPMVLVALVVTGLVARKEKQLAAGQTVLLRLAPTDPRSLLQGDYMVLRYELAPSVTAWGNEGVVNVRLDAHDIAVALAPGTDADADPDDDVVALRWHRVRGNLVFGADSFFFAEGEGERLARAAFVEVKVTPDGTPVLLHLLDEQRVALTP